jgi:hypothetical protein
MAREDEIVAAVRERYGSIINIEASPELIIDIIREFGSEVDVTHPPTPTVGDNDPTVSDIMKMLLKISRDVNVLKKHLGVSNEDHR